MLKVFLLLLIWINLFELTKNFSIHIDSAGDFVALISAIEKNPEDVAIKSAVGF
jgi:hypothetical protein